MIAQDRTRLTDLSHIPSQTEHYIESSYEMRFLYNVLIFIALKMMNCHNMHQYDNQMPVVQ